MSKSVLVIGTGGTIVMKLNEAFVYTTENANLSSWLQKQQNLHDEGYASLQQQRGRDDQNHPNIKSLFLPVIRGNEVTHIRYEMLEYSPLIDSSNMEYSDMLKIAQDIEERYEDFDGFVVLHGTDTMCYTAAVLSFLLNNLGKPVILTGAQIPIYETMSDGRDNFTGALIMAAESQIPEVCIFFANKLLRGNRATKISADTLDAFDSPNCPPLAKFDVYMSVNQALVRKRSEFKEFDLPESLSKTAVVWKISPSMPRHMIEAYMNGSIKGIVMECYGTGNLPNKNKEFLELIKQACHCREVIIVCTTQCRNGTVSTSYTGAQALCEAGVIFGSDMTSEAALAKLVYALNKDWSLEDRKKFMRDNIAGELSTNEMNPSNNFNNNKY